MPPSFFPHRTEVIYCKIRQQSQPLGQLQTHSQVFTQPSEPRVAEYVSRIRCALFKLQYCGILIGISPGGERTLP